MSFIDGLENEMNISITENGARGFRTTGKALLDFNFKIATYREKSVIDIQHDFTKVWNENKELALKFLFYIRDIREGVGERRLFREAIKPIINELDTRVFDWIEEYGRLDDLFIFMNTGLESAMVSWVKAKLTADMFAHKEGKPCSLMAKWMPSINTSSNETRRLANIFVNAFGISKKEYRKMLSGLRGHIKVLEKQLCANKWSEVDYEAVPSMANLKYKDAFKKHDKERRQAYLDALDRGEAKINSSVTFPHDIVNKYGMCNGWRSNLKNYDAALEAMWKSLPDYVQGNGNVLVVRDGSGSMTTSIGKTNISALDVATALAIYFSERAEGPYKDKFITFSSKPELIDLSKLNTLRAKLLECYKYDDCSNTDIEATFDLVLRIAVKNNLRQDQLPTLMMVSDMEFDDARGNYSRRWGYSSNSDDSKLFETIAKKYAKYGYKLPRLVFWNVHSSTGTIPVKENENGVALVSGFSAAITKLVLSNETDPYKVLVNELMSKRYSQITLKTV